MNKIKATLKNTRWVCIQSMGDNRRGDWVNESTLSFYRYASKEKLLKGTTTDWKQAKKYGWRCVKVELIITEI